MLPSARVCVVTTTHYDVAKSFIFCPLTHSLSLIGSSRDALHSPLAIHAAYTVCLLVYSLLIPDSPYFLPCTVAKNLVRIFTSLV